MAEYLSRAMALAQDAAKLSLRFSEEIVDNALEFGLDTPGSFYNNAEYNLTTVRKTLNSGTDKEKVVAMKRLLVVIAKGVDASEYFADVVKNVASGSLEVRRLVYMYLLRYAEQEQDLALLSVNTFQRDLADANQVIRAMALRVMTSIRVPVISAIAMMAVRKLAKDRSPHVRKTAALAIPKLLRLDRSLRDELVQVVGDMLGEASPLAVGSVIQAFRAVCPTDYGLVHLNYRRWCLLVGELDEWGQIELIKLLVAYARTHFADPAGAGAGKLDPDHALLLRTIHPLLQSRNSAVVMAVVSAYYHLAPADQLAAVARPLVRLARTSRETGYVALANVVQIAQRRPEIFSTHVRSFYVAALDPPFIRRLKMRVLAAVASAETVRMLVPEVAGYTQSTQEDVSVGAVGVLLACAQRIRESTMDCFQSLVLLLDDPREAVVGEAVRAIRTLLLDGSVRDSQDRRAVTLYDILCHLARRLDGAGCTGDMARAHIFSLVSEFATSKFGCLHALEMLRRGARAFRDEGEQTKMQVLELSARLVVLAKREAGSGAGAGAGTGSRGDDISARLQQHKETLADLHAHVFTLARYDVSFEIRDRARLLRALCPLGGDEAHGEKMPNVVAMGGELAGDASSRKTMLLLGAQASESVRRPRYTVGSMSLAMDAEVSGYEALPDWAPTPVEGIDRGAAPASVAAVSPAGSVAPGGARAISIAGISGRAQPHSLYADYSTPRSVDARDAEGGEEDLDAFLNSEDDKQQRPATRATPQFVHAPLTASQRTAVVFQQAELDSESSFSDSDSDESESGGESENKDESKSDSQSGSSSGSESSAEAAGSAHDPFAGLGDPFAGARSMSQPQPDRSAATATATAADSDSDTGTGTGTDDETQTQTQPLIEGTSKYWQ
ncbi:AP-3 complex subunit beta [Coemansia sp. RSA 1804]|nr:AP-3 complex subunit beta [Coemansia sp. RSA 1804]